MNNKDFSNLTNSLISVKDKLKEINLIKLSFKDDYNIEDNIPFEDYPTVVENKLSGNIAAQSCDFYMAIDNYEPGETWRGIRLINDGKGFFEYEREDQLTGPGPDENNRIIISELENYTENSIISGKYYSPDCSYQVTWFRKKPHINYINDINVSGVAGNPIKINLERYAYDIDNEPAGEIEYDLSMINRNTG